MRGWPLPKVEANLPLCKERTPVARHAAPSFRMLKRARFVAAYVVFWVLFFECARVLFLLYHWKNTARLDSAVAFGTLLHGLRLDLSGACALALIPACVVARAGFIPDRVTRFVVKGYTLGFTALVGVLTVADLEIFRVWGYHLDVNALRYLANPREAFASASGSPLPLLLAILVIVLLVITVGFYRGVLPFLAHLRPISQGRSLLLLLLFLPVLAIGALGGFRWRVPLTAGSVYFSRDHFANQAAVNPAWNFFVSATGATEEGTVETYAESHIGAGAT